MAVYNKSKYVGFRATPEQWQRIEQLAAAVDKNPSELLRELVDGATLARPMIMSTFGQPPVGDQRMAVQHGT